MTPERALRDRLVADATVAALIGTRIYPPGELPQEPRLPALVYQRISMTDGLAQDGTTGPQRPRIQLDAYARTQREVESVQDAIREAVHGQTWAAGDGSQVMLGVLDNSRDLPADWEASPEPSVRLKRRSADYFIHFRK